MPLKTRSFTLREECDKKADRLDELADHEADLIMAFEESAGGGDGNGNDETGTGAEGMSDADLADLRNDLEETREEAAEVQDHHEGLAWAVERFGPERATDGGQPMTDSDSDSVPTANTDASDAEIRAALEADTDHADAGDAGGTTDTTPETTMDGRTVAGTASVGDGAAGNDPLATTGQKAAASANQTQSATPDTDTGGPVEVTLGGLTAGEFAKVNDINAAQASQMGFASEQLAEDGSALTVTVAAGTFDAPYLTSGANLRTQANEVGNLHPAYVRWCRSEIEALTSPSAKAGNDYGALVSAKIAKRQAAGEKADGGAEPPNR